MANFPALKMTAEGREIQSKAQTGQELKFTRVALGDGVYAPDPAASVLPIAALVSEKHSLSIQRQVTAGDGTSVLTVIMTNQGLLQGFDMRELGLFVLDPDTGVEALYSYSNAGDQGDYLPSAGGAMVWEGVFDLVTIVGNAANVTAVIDDFITIALKKEVDALRPYVLPVGGLVDDILVKASNKDGASKWLSLSLAGLQMRFGSVEEYRVATEGQTVFTLEKTLTNGMGVYVNGARINRDQDWTALSAKQLQMTKPLAAGSRVLFVNNEEVSASAAVDVTLDGPTLVYAGSSNTFTITNFDSSAVYVVAASVGTLTRAKDVLTLVLPAGQAAGTLDLSITRDGVKKTRKVAIGAAAIMAPQITSPVNGATGVLFEPNIVASSFTVYPSGYDTQKQTRWQIATTSTFDAASLVVDLTTADYLDALPLASIQKRLDPAKRYYGRAMHIGQTLTGTWSATVYFNTASIYVRKPSIVAPLDGADKVSLSFTFEASAFSVAGGADEHVASRWQLSLFPDFRSVVEDTGWSATQLLKYKPTSSMARKMPHYIRVAQKGKAAGESEWSAAVSFQSAAPLAGTATALGSGATARAEHTMSAIAGALWVIGGTAGSSVFKYDIESKVWQQKTPLTANLSRHAAAVVDGKIYLFGGSANGGSTPLGALVRYDPETGVSSVLQSGPPARTFGWMVESGGYLYVGGGLAASGSLVDLWRYNIQLNSWAQLANPPAAQQYGIAGADGKSIVALPGTQRTEKVHVYDIGTNTWKLGAQAITSICWSSGALVSGLLYTIGGVDGGSGGVRNARTVMEYDPTADSWKQLVDFPAARYFMASCEYEGSLYCFGGSNGNSTYYNTLYRLD